jgi:A/G-specific adenine glycosylase
LLEYVQMISKKKIAVFQKDILSWYAINKRDLPWRKTRDPYSILISEVMSQQTQLSRVVIKYDAWMEIFPTVEVLANASVAQVLQYWSGLGYNRRALHLKKTAEKVVSEFNGVFPQTEKELMSLPGIGKYTANAVLCFAFDQQIAVVDTNVRKVILTQVLNFENSENQGIRESEILTIRDSDNQSIQKRTGNKIDERLIETLATQLLPKGRAYEWNQALMDYASAVLKKEKISIPKQSKFVGSQRYYRGQILKILLKKKKVHLDELGFLIKKEYTSVEEEWLKKIVDELIKEGFVFFKNNILELSY